MLNLWLLLAAEIIIWILVFVVMKQNIMTPSVILTSVFIVSTVITVLNGENWKIDYSFEAMLLLVLGISLFAITDVMICKMRKDNNTSFSNTVKKISIDKWKHAIIIIIDILILSLIYKEIKRIASTQSYYTNIFYAYRMITSHSNNQTAGQKMNVIPLQGMKIITVTAFIDIYIFVNNVVACKDKIIKNLPYLIPPVILCLMSIFTGVRTSILKIFTGMLVYSYILIQTKNGWSVKTSWKFIRPLIMIVIFVIVGFASLQSFLGRSGSTDIVSVISIYIGASIYAFSQYIVFPPAANEVFGQETLSGFWKILYKLGLTEQLYSVHEEYRYIDEKNSGNVYTIFRAFIQDYGIIGMCIATILLAAIFSILYNWKIKNKPIIYKRMILIIEYGYIFYIIAISSIGNIVSDFLNGGTFLIFILFHIFCWFYFKCKFKYGI